MLSGRLLSSATCRARVINVVTKQGGERFLYDASYYGQASALTSQPITLRYLGSGEQQSGYERAKYRGLHEQPRRSSHSRSTVVLRGYQWLRDYDSQPGTDPTLPRTYEMQKLFAKLTWRLAPGWQLVQSFHNEIGIDPERPTIVTPFEATARDAHLGANDELRRSHAHDVGQHPVGCSRRPVRFPPERRPERTESDNAKPVRPRHRRHHRRDDRTAQPSTCFRTTAKATLTHYRRALDAEHQWKIGGQFERGEHHAINFIPTGVRYEDRAGQPLQSISSLPSNIGGVSLTSSVFATDTMTMRDRLTITGGVRFDHSRAISQDLRAVDADGHETGAVIDGLGTMYTWNLWSPRLGVTTKLSADGRTMLRASYGRFFQGVFTGELEPFHPGATAVTMAAFNSTSGDYSGPAHHGRSQGQLAVGSRRCARREPTSTPSASIAPSALG